MFSYSDSLCVLQQHCYWIKEWAVVERIIIQNGTCCMCTLSYTIVGIVCFDFQVLIMQLKHEQNIQEQVISCRAASVSEQREANDCVLFVILLCIYIYIYVRTLCKQVLQLHKLDGCTLVALQPCSTLFSGSSALWCFFRSQSIGFRLAGALPPLCCLLVQCAVASCSASISSSDSHLKLSISTNAG